MLELMFHLLWKIQPTKLSCERKELQGPRASILCLTHAKSESTFAYKE